MYIYRYLLKYRISPNNIYSNDKCYPKISVMRELEPDGANFCTINDGENIKDVSQKVAALRPTIEKLKKIGLYKDAYFYSFDELGFQVEKYDKAKIMGELELLRNMLRKIDAKTKSDIKPFEVVSKINSMIENL